MNWLILTQIILSLLYVWHLVQSYSLKTVPLYLKFLIFATWTLSFGIVLILPLDIYYTISEDAPASSNSILIVWKVAYWLNFMLTWFLLPIAQEYELAGEFDWRARLKRAVINNLITYVIFLVCGAAFLVYLIFRGDFQLHEVTAILVAASNVFGMVLVVILLSHGIVEIPKKLWRQKKYEGALLENQYYASIIAHEKQDLLQELELKVKEILAFQKENGKTLESQLVLRLVPEELLKSWQRSVPRFQQIDIINVHKQVKKMVLDLDRLETKWQTLMLETFRIQDILKDMNSVNHQIESTLFTHYRCGFVNTIIWLWYCRIKLIFFPLICLILAVFAVAVVLGEVAVFSSWFDMLNVFRLVNLLDNFVAIDICTLIPLFYISFCVFYSLFKMKLAGFYSLYKNHTDAPSLIFFALNCSRVSAPLCYNFFQLVSIPDSAYSQVMGTVDIVPIFGRTFNIIFPILMLILIVFNAFDIYTKIFKAVGIQRFQFDQENLSQQSVADGRRRLAKARVEVESRLLNDKGKDLGQYRSYKIEV